MTHLFYYRILTSFLGNFSGKFDLLMLCGDIESNPGPRPNSSQSFSICHWNLNSIKAHNFSKISLLRAYNGIHNYDICLSETYLNHDTLSYSDNLKIPGYELIRVLSPIKSKTRWCLYISQRFSTNKSKQYKLFEGMLKFRSECIWETV